MNSAKNYTIVFNQNPQGRPLQVAANSILNEETGSIKDYYNKKFQKKKTTLEEITEEGEN